MKVLFTKSRMEFNIKILIRRYAVMLNHGPVVKKHIAMENEPFEYVLFVRRLLASCVSSLRLHFSCSIGLKI